MMYMRSRIACYKPVHKCITIVMKRGLIYPEYGCKTPDQKFIFRAMLVLIVSMFYSYH